MRNKLVFANSDIDSIDDDHLSNYFRPVLKDVLRCIDKPINVCDVGCGNGVFTSFLKKETNCTLYGIDGSDYALEKARLLEFDELRQVSDFSTTPLPFKDESFDLVVNKDVLEHLLHPDYLVSEMARITSGGGHLLIHVPNHFPIVGRLKLLFFNTIDPFNYFPEAHRWDFPHIRFFTKNDFLDLMYSFDLKPVANLCHHFPSFPKIGRLMTAGMKKWLTQRYPDAWAEGFTYLFQK